MLTFRTGPTGSGTLWLLDDLHLVSDLLALLGHPGGRAQRLVGHGNDVGRHG